MNLNRNEIYLVQITGYAHDGSGVGRVDNQVIFIPGALRGEEVKVKITRKQKGILRGEILQIVQAARERTNPCCEAFETCGGCQLQHMDYSEQLRFKGQIVKETLKRIGGLGEIPVHPVLGMAQPWGYRNKGVFQAGLKGEKIVLGFYEEGSHSLASRFCGHLFSPSVVQLLAYLEELLNTRGIRAAKENLPGLSHVLVRESRASGDILLVFFVSGEYNGIDYGISREICLNNLKVVGVCQNKNPGAPGLVSGVKNRVIYGRGEIEDSIGPFNFLISAPSFFQVNTEQARVLYNKTLEYAGLSGRETVIDAYCGTGTITLFLARKAGRVIGIESVQEAVDDARKNAGRNDVRNVEFIRGEAEKTLPRLAAQGIKPDVVVVDPPRKGCDKALVDSIIRVRPERVVYVSCNPATLARDLKILAGGGYKVTDVQPVDMFPQTVHTETVCLIERGESIDK